MSLISELGSAASTLEQLLERVSTSADGLVESGDEDVAYALMDVERSLRTANRRLERIVRDLRNR